MSAARASAAARELHAEVIRWSGGWCSGDDCETCRQVIVPALDAFAAARVAEERKRTDRLRQAIRDALNELGVPGDGYPMPVVNAHVILSEALRAPDGAQA